MSGVRHILGKTEVEIAERKRICHHNRRKHVIVAGERCLVVHDGPHGAGKNYCRECAASILNVAQQDLTQLREALSV